MNKGLLVVMLWALSLSASTDDYIGPYEKYFVISLGDLYNVCDRLNNPGSREADSFIKSHTCLTYFAGILTGYSSTLAISAEFQIAKKLNKPRSNIEAQMDSNHTLHNQVTEVSVSSQFLCRKEGIHLATLAITVLSNLKNKGITRDRSAHYFVLNELARIQPCD